jgi:hypothetical protein
MNTDNNILEKIKKLLRLSGSSNPHEAALALAKALALADEHNLKLCEIEREATDRVELGRKDFAKRQRMAYEWHLGFNVIQNYFNVSVCYGQYEFTLIGREDDIAVAHYVFDFLVRKAREVVSERKRLGYYLSGLQIKNLKQGFFDGIYHQLQLKRFEMVAANCKFSLVLANQQQARLDEMARLFGKVRERKIKEPASSPHEYQIGYREGFNTVITVPLEAGTPNAGALTA